MSTSQIDRLLETTIKKGASDLHLAVREVEQLWTIAGGQRGQVDPGGPPFRAL